MIDSFATYLKKLRETPVAEHTEHTGRGALETLLNVFAAKGKNLKVLHEPKRVAKMGAPDFKIHHLGQILGYVEVKEFGTNLEKELKSDQIAKYRKLSSNIILTDYLDFIWIDEKHVKMHVRLAHVHDLESKTLHVDPAKAVEVKKLLEAFFSVAPQGVDRAQQLALALATRSQLLRDYLTLELVRQEKSHQEGRLFGLFSVFKTQVFHELTVKEFADAFAQMLAYGLFLARLNSGSHTVTLNNAREFVPGSFRLIRELVDFLGELNKEEYRDIRWVVEEVLSIVNGLILEAIHADLSFQKRKAISRNIRAQDEEEHRLFERDPFIYFYEDYLKAYDKETRKGRGVYYTPPPVVNFIVRAVDDILKETFEIDDGLADHKRVTVLDFACGTGTFLLEVFEKVFDNIGGPDSGKAGPMVREHLLKNIYGFEYLIAPYTIAHLKLSQYLRDKGHPLEQDERLQVFLTNTLEPISPQPNFLLPGVTEEVKAAQAVKDKPILVIIGNPPYSGASKNNSPFVKATIDAYKMVDGKPLGEKNPKWLQDDYVKFIRFAQMKMDEVEEGIVGIITNHSWLDNPTFRGMRASLMQSFQQIYVLDLHGSTKPKELAPNGLMNENVFDIQKGVAISIFLKRKGLERGVWRGDLWGTRLEKYQHAMTAKFTDKIWEPIEPQAPSLTFAVTNRLHQGFYNRARSLTDIFEDESVGLMSGRDHLAFQFTKSELKNTLTEFVGMDAESARTNFNLRQDVRDWRVAWAQDDVRSSGLVEENFRQIMYRPFDARWTYYTGKSRGFHCYPRTAVSDMIVSGPALNVALLSARSNKSQTPDHFFVTSQLSEAKTAESTTQSYFFPLLGKKAENLSPDFRIFLDARYDHHYGPEEILGYIYSVLYAPTYRRRYAAFLRLDFPRIPFAETRDHFDALSKLGWDLVQVHLLKKKPRLKLANLEGKGSNEIEAVRYSPQERAIHINKAQHFAPVLEDVWNFHIGGYQVLDKYLKSRKGRTLSLDEMNHIGHVADALAFTISQMQAIDEAYAAAFPGRG